MTKKRIFKILESLKIDYPKPVTYFAYNDGWNQALKKVEELIAKERK